MNEAVAETTEIVVGPDYILRQGVAPICVYFPDPDRRVVFGCAHSEFSQGGTLWVTGDPIKLIWEVSETNVPAILAFFVPIELGNGRLGVVLRDHFTDRHLILR